MYVPGPVRGAGLPPPVPRGSNVNPHLARDEGDALAGFGSGEAVKLKGMTVFDPKEVT